MVGGDTPFLKMVGISKRFVGVQALDNVDLILDRGEVHCIAGENGSGKSTLIKIISGNHQPTAGGSIEIDGVKQTNLTPEKTAELGIQVIYQDLSLFPNMTVAENIAISEHLGRPHVASKARIQASARTALERMGQSIDLNALVSELPIATRQIVAICRALAANARLVIMDEPTASLTRPEVKALLSLINQLRNDGITIVFVSHKLDEVMEVADQLTVLRGGACVGTYPATDMNDKKLGVLMTGKEFHYEPRNLDLSDAPVVLDVKNLSRKGEYEDISLKVRAGEILGIIGLLGAGRTELALSLFGMSPPETGAVTMEGKPVSLNSNRQAIECGIAYVSEDRLNLGLVLEQPISENIVASVLNRITRWGLVDKAKYSEIVRTQIGDLAIKVADPEAPVNTLSGGNQQRVAIGKWLACVPRLLILDSPTVGVDISAKDGIYDLIAKLAECGVAVIMISDEVPEVLYHSHRILMMSHGRIAGEFMPSNVSEESLGNMVNA